MDNFADLVFIVFIISVFPRGFLLHANASVRPKDYIAMNDEPPNNYSLSGLNTTSQDSDMQTKTQYIDVEISGGVVRGVISNVGSRPANVFRGIPQAEPPVGKLRFEQLRARKSWRPKVWNAMEYRPACLSNTSKTTSPQFNIDEDCVYTNIYADPECRKDGKAHCPVLFYIHGGAFAYGSAVMFNETQIVQKYATDGLVFVICAYRIGFLGFLDLGNDDVVPRNLAFYDIIYNLEWARKEIRSFGGDPEQITIMGNSAGASFVIYLLQSPKVPRSMFKQAVVSSGIALIMRDLDRQPSLEILRRFKCLHDDKTNLTFTDRNKVECMRNVNANDIIAVQRRNEDTLNLTFRGPETDTKLLPGEIFWDLLPSHKAHPLLITTTSVETTFFPNTLDVECRAVEMPYGFNTDAVHQACMRRYNETFGTDDPSISADKFQAESFITSLTNARRGYPTYRGYFSMANHTGHADDMLFFFGLHWRPIITPAEKLMDQYYPQMIKDFVKTGIPDKEWKPVDQNGRNYFVLDFPMKDDAVVGKPHPMPGYENLGALTFWFHDAPLIEKNAQRASGRTYSPLVLSLFSMDDNNPFKDVKNGRLRSTVWTPLGVPSELMVLLLLMVIMMAICSAIRIMNRYRSSSSPATESTRIFSKDTTRRILYT